jgi:hypothetical protein
LRAERGCCGTRSARYWKRRARIGPMRVRPGDVLETTLDSDSNFAEIEKVLVIEEVSFRLDEFHAVRIRILLRLRKF